MKPIKLKETLAGKAGDYLFIRQDGTPAVLTGDHAEFLLASTEGASPKAQKARKKKPKELTHRRRVALYYMLENFGDRPFTTPEFFEAKNWPADYSRNQALLIELEQLECITIQRRWKETQSYFNGRVPNIIQLTEKGKQGASTVTAPSFNVTAFN